MVVSMRYFRAASLGLAVLLFVVVLLTFPLLFIFAARSLG